jgi:hypothetical protein
VTLSQLTELGEQGVAAIASSLARGGPVVRGQLIASRFYEAVQRELKQSPIHDPKGAALIAASDRCERIAVANINPSVLVDELRQAIAVLKTDENPSEPQPITQRPVLRLIEGTPLDEKRGNHRKHEVDSGKGPEAAPVMRHLPQAGAQLIKPK